MQPDNPNLSKEEIRRRIWSLMEESNIASFPRPVYGRIPNFVGSDIAARRLSELEEFKRARVVKVNPDAPQITVRYLTLLEGKMLLMPTPRLKSGFLMLNPKSSLKEPTAKRRRSVAHSNTVRHVELMRLPL